MTTRKRPTVEDLMKLTSWSRTAAASCLCTDIAGVGYGLMLDGHVYRLTLPTAMAKPLIVEAAKD